MIHLKINYLYNIHFNPKQEYFHYLLIHFNSIIMINNSVISFTSLIKTIFFKFYLMIIIIVIIFMMILRFLYDCFTNHSNLIK